MQQGSYLAEYGSGLLSGGYPIVPIKPGTKMPGFVNWQHTKADDKLLKKWLSNGFAKGGVGVLTRDYPGVDIDVRDTDVVQKLVEWCEEHIGATVQRVGLAPKILLVYRTDTPFKKIASAKYSDFLGLEHKVEILGDGQQFVAYAMHPDTKKPYEWVSKQDLSAVAAADLPVITCEQAQALVDYFESIIPDDWIVVEKAPTSAQVDPTLSADERVLAHLKPKVDISTAKLQKALSYLDPDMRMHEWVRIGMALHHQYDGGSDGFALWDGWSAAGGKYAGKEMRTRWNSFRADLGNTNPVTCATILQQAKQAYKEKKRDTPRQTGFQLIHVADVIAKIGPIDWRIKGFLERDTTGLIFGDPGSFKSFIALDMAFHVAAGKDWHGRAVEQGPVIYIAGEGHGGLARRFVAWQQHHSTPLADLPIYVSEQAAQFYDHESAQQVVAAVDEIAQHGGPPAMIVIDTLARNFGAGDENSNNDMGQFINHVDGMLRARFGATVVVVHHSGQSHKERARGASALKGGMDFEYRIEKAETGMTARLCCTKMKDAREPADVWFEGREITIGGFEEDITSLVFDRCAAPVEEEKPLKGKQAALYEIIKKEAPLRRDTLREMVLAEGVFETADQLKNALQQLRKKELVSEEEGWMVLVDAFF